MREDLVYNIAKTIHAGKEDLVRGHPVFRSFDPGRMTEEIGVPYHPVAIKFYVETGQWRQSPRCNRRLGNTGRSDCEAGPVASGRLHERCRASNDGGDIAEIRKSKLKRLKRAIGVPPNSNRFD